MICRLELGEQLLTVFFVAVLSVIWLAVFLPAVMRARQSAPVITAEQFKRSMELIAPSTMPVDDPVQLVVEEARDRKTLRQARRRRTRILASLVTGAVFTLWAALLLGGAWWEVHVVVDLTVALYVVLLVEAKKRRQERSAKVKPMTPRRLPPVYRAETVKLQAFGGRH